MKVTLRSANGNEVDFDLPSKMEVCSDCHGHGMVMNESMRSHAYTLEEFNRDFDDEEKQEYFRRGGMYDVQCPTCHGKNVVEEIDRDACKGIQLFILKAWDKQQKKEAAYKREEKLISRMENGFF